VTGLLVIASDVSGADACRANFMHACSGKRPLPFYASLLVFYRMHYLVILCIPLHPESVFKSKNLRCRMQDISIKRIIEVFSHVVRYTKIHDLRYTTLHPDVFPWHLKLLAGSI